MNYLSVEELSKIYDEKKLFENITFGLEQGQKAALVGVNGTGKSTLMRVIAGLETPDKGLISFRKGLTVSMLPKHPQFNPEDKEELNVIRDYERAMFKIENDPENAPDLTLILERMDALNAGSTSV